VSTQGYSARCAAIHLLRSGCSSQEVAEELSHSRSWVYKWRTRFQREGWIGLHDRSRTPHRQPTRHSDSIRQAIRRVRSELEAEAEQPDQLSYIGARAIQSRLRHEKHSRIPSITSIERELHAAGMTRPQRSPPPDKDVYPHLQPQQARQLVQVDIYPRYLQGGQAIACFNAIDVVSRYPTGMQYIRRRSKEAADFLVHTWQTVGIPTYTQLDNEGCFSGGATHPYVLGKVVKLALLVGTQPVFSPFYHPASNGFVERFHQDYGHEVWQKIHLANIEAVRKHSLPFFQRYRNSEHHTALLGRSPAEVHTSGASVELPSDFRIPKSLPLTEGQVHFMRQVDQTRHVKILNVLWMVPEASPGQGVWATLELRQSGAKLRVFDAAPDAPQRRCLVIHTFPLKEPVMPVASQFQRPCRTPAKRWGAPLQAIVALFHDVVKVCSLVKVPIRSTMS